MKNIFFIVALIFTCNFGYAQQEIYHQRDLITGATDTAFISLNGVWKEVTIAIADTTGTPTLNAKVNYDTDSTWFNAYVFTNYNTTAVNLSLATPEGNIYSFLDKAIRKLKLYITGGTLTYELKAKK